MPPVFPGPDVFASMWSPNELLFHLQDTNRLRTLSKLMHALGSTMIQVHVRTQSLTSPQGDRRTPTWSFLCLFSWTFSRRFVAQEKTHNRHQCQSDYCQRKREGQSAASASPSTKRPKVETRRNHWFRQSLTSTSKGSAKHLLPTLQELIYTTNKRRTIEKKEHPHSEEGTKCSNKPTYQSIKLLLERNQS